MAQAAKSTKPAKSIDLTKVDDDKLASLLNSAGDDEAQVDAIIAEMNRRDEIERKIDELVEAGYGYADAWCEAHDIDRAEMDRMEARALLNAQRWQGESIEQCIDRLFTEDCDRRFAQAEHDCKGYLLNEEGRKAKVDPRSLFLGQAKRARKYASDELKAWWMAYGRVTWIEYKAQLTHRPSDIAAAARIDRDFGEAPAMTKLDWTHTSA
jgi:hypothetical protein